MKDLDIDQIKRLAGIDSYSGLKPYDVLTDHQNSSEKKITEKRLNIKPGTNEWFDLWFSGQSRSMNMIPGFRGRRK